MRPVTAALTVACVAATLTAAYAADEPRVIRVEPRPFYGATVTVEHGVRVYRSLPPHSEVIIAPQDGPPVNVHVWRESGADAAPAPSATASASASANAGAGGTADLPLAALRPHRGDGHPRDRAAGFGGRPGPEIRAVPLGSSPRR